MLRCLLEYDKINWQSTLQTSYGATTKEEEVDTYQNVSRDGLTHQHQNYWNYNQNKKHDMSLKTVDTFEAKGLKSGMGKINLGI